MRIYLLLLVLVITGCAQDFSLRYRYTTEIAYFDAEIADSRLTYTHPDYDAVKERCAQWVQQAPCWTQKDLVTEQAPLSQSERSELLGLIHQTGVMDLESYYGPREGERCYTYTLTVELDDEKTVVYCSRPGSVAPEAFDAITLKIEEIVDAKFSG